MLLPSAIPRARKLFYNASFGNSHVTDTLDLLTLNKHILLEIFVLRGIPNVAIPSKLKYVKHLCLVQDVSFQTAAPVDSYQSLIDACVNAETVWVYHKQVDKLSVRAAESRLQVSKDWVHTDEPVWHPGVGLMPPVKSIGNPKKSDKFLHDFLERFAWLA